MKNATKEKRCCDCRDGEHENLTENVRLYTVRNKSTKKLVKRGYFCEDHVHCILSDGEHELIEG